MKTKKVEGKQKMKVAGVKKLMSIISQALKKQTEVTGSLDEDDYGARMSFVLEGMVIGLSYSTLGGSACQ